MRRGARSNKALLLTANSAFQVSFGSLLASTLGAQAASDGLLAAAERRSVRYSVPNQVLSAKNFVPSKSASYWNMPWMACSSFLITATSACIGFFPFARSFS